MAEDFKDGGVCPGVVHHHDHALILTSVGSMNVSEIKPEDVTRLVVIQKTRSQSLGGGDRDDVPQHTPPLFA